MAMTPIYGKNPYFNLPKEEIAKLVKVSPYGIDGSPESSITELMSNGSYYLRYRIKSKDGLRVSQWSSIHNVSFPQGPDGKVSTIYEMNGYPISPTIRPDLHSVNVSNIVQDNVSNIVQERIDSSISRVTPGADVLTYNWTEPKFLPNQYFDVFLSWRKVYKIDWSGNSNVSNIATVPSLFEINGESISGFTFLLSNLEDTKDVSPGDEIAMVNVSGRTQPNVLGSNIYVKQVVDKTQLICWCAVAWGGTGTTAVVKQVSGIGSIESSPWEFAGTTSSTSLTFKQKVSTYEVVATVRSACFPKVFNPYDLTTYISMSERFSTYQGVTGNVAAAAANATSAVTNLTLPPPSISGKEVFDSDSLGSWILGNVKIDTLPTTRTSMSIKSTAAISARTATGIRL
jgi:hypothetical protein